MNEDKISASVVAQILELSARRVNQLAVQGKLPFQLLQVANGRFTRLFNKQDIEKYREEKRRKL